VSENRSPVPYSSSPDEFPSRSCNMLVCVFQEQISRMLRRGRESVWRSWPGRTGCSLSCFRPSETKIYYSGLFSSESNRWKSTSILSGIFDKISDVAKKAGAGSGSSWGSGSGAGGSFFGGGPGIFKDMMLEMMRHCEEAHAKEIADRMGIKFNSISFQKDSLSSNKVHATVLYRGDLHASLRSRR